MHERKLKHIEIVRTENVEPVAPYWDQYRLPYKTLPELDFTDIDTSTTWFGKTLQQPLLISSMTGGATLAKSINENAARAAEACGVALGLGSMRIMLKDPSVADSFTVRTYCPSVPLLANIGAIQLNYGVTADDINHLVDAVDADGVFLHINALQEVVQPEGDTNFSGLLAALDRVVPKIERPVIIKEVGHGIDPDTMSALMSLPIAGIDVAGVGGTSWVQVEGYRRSDRLGELFKAVGYQTDECLTQLRTLPAATEKTVIASGGLRSGVDGAKSLMLGAQLYGTAKPLLEPAIKDTDTLIAELENWHHEFKTAMFAVGARTIDALQRTPLIPPAA